MVTTPRPEAGRARPAIGALRWLMAAGAGALEALSHAPVNQPLLQIGALALFFAILWRAADQGLRPIQAAGLGLAFAWPGFTVGLAWLHISMHQYGGMPAPLAALALLLFAAYLAAFTAGVCAITVALGDDRQPWVRVLAVSGLWALGELLRGWLFTGFPWLSTGYAQIDSPLAAVAPWVGVHGVSLVTVLVAAGLGLLTARPRPIDRRLLASVLGCCALVAALVLLAAQLRPEAAPGQTLTISLLQGNVPQDLKFDPVRARRAMEDYIKAIDGRPSDLTVLPETAWTVPWSHTPAEIRGALLARVAATGGAVAIGMPLPVDGVSDAWERGITNGVAVLDGSGTLLARYDKRHLVPFGEFVPWGFRWFVDLMNIPLGEFHRGARHQAPLTLKGERIGFNICYEDLFGHQLAEQVRHGASILVNTTNIGWFGRSHALGQHLAIARMRSLELARPMLRSTNTGVTAAIDHRGRVIERLPDHRSGALIVQVTGQSVITPFARFGLWPITWLAGLLASVPAALLCLNLVRAGRRAGLNR
jgi:apolipoprotein N-acyltransferase